MKHLASLIVLLVCATSGLTQSSTVTPVRKVSALPSTCFANTTNPVIYQGKLYLCTATDTWTQVGTFLTSGIEIATGAAAQIFRGRYNSSNPSAGIITDSAGNTYFAGGIYYNAADKAELGSVPSYKIGYFGNTSISYSIRVAAGTTINTTPSFTDALTVRSDGKIGLNTTSALSDQLVVVGATITGRAAAIRGTGNGNGYFFGHAATGYLSTLGAFSGSGQPFISFYSYHSTTSNTLRRADGSNLPSYFTVTTAGTLEYYTAPAGTVDADISDFTKRFSILTNGTIQSAGLTFANLGTPSNGSIIYCTDCTKATPCASGGTGAIAKRLNSQWDCN